MQQLKQTYHKKAVPALMKKLGYSNIFEVPRVRKITLNIGTSRSRSNSKIVETMEQTLLRITGQKPVQTLARKSIAAFKIREGQVVGMKVTLRGKRMYDFLEKCIHVTFPRVRDFQGISRASFDQRGQSLTIGFKENLAFPEIKSDEIEKLHGLEMTISLDSKGVNDSIEMLRELGFPFRTEEQERTAQESERRAKADMRARDRERKKKMQLAKESKEIMMEKEEVAE